MIYYRLYVRDGSPSGRFIAVEEIYAPDDAGALQIAARHSGAFLELWQHERRVVILEYGRPKETVRP
jgi:hypothetical protein